MWPVQENRKLSRNLWKSLRFENQYLFSGINLHCIGAFLVGSKAVAQCFFAL